VLNAGLVTRDTEKYQTLPWMAEALPSLDDGSWQINPDGTMVTTWRVKPNIKWHDGTAFKTSDFAFGHRVFTDSKMEIESRGYMELMDRLDTPDDRTLVIHWKSRFSYAPSLFFTTLMPLPEHILGEQHRNGDYDGLNNSTYWNATLVHLGPFKVAEFAPGSHVDMVAFDDYFLGRPKVDRILWRIIPDANALLTAVLTNDVDVTTRAALNLDTAIVAEEQWASRGEGTVRYGPTSWSWVNPSATSPIFGWDAPNQNKVRQAILHSINRQEIVDIPLGRALPQYPAAEAAAKKYPYDARLAQQLFSEAGWNKAADGSSQTGAVIGCPSSFETRQGLNHRLCHQSPGTFARRAWRSRSCSSRTGRAARSKTATIGQDWRSAPTTRSSKTGLIDSTRRTRRPRRTHG